MIETEERVGPAERTAAGSWGFALAVGYAVFVRFYQAAGGRIGLNGDPGPDVEWASYVAGLLVLVGGAACLVLTRKQLRTVPRWVPGLAGREAPRRLVAALCVAPTLLGGVLAVAHGAGGGLAKALELAGAGRASIHPDATAPEPVVVDAVWEVLFYEPWFTAMGVCLLLSAVRYCQARMTPRTVRSVARGAVGASVALALVWLLAMRLHWPLDTGLLF